jgi:hypothetical protein
MHSAFETFAEQSADPIATFSLLRADVSKSGNRFLQSADARFERQSHQVCRPADPKLGLDLRTGVGDRLVP